MHFAIIARAAFGFDAWLPDCMRVISDCPHGFWIQTEEEAVSRCAVHTGLGLVAACARAHDSLGDVGMSWEELCSVSC